MKSCCGGEGEAEHKPNASDGDKKPFSQRFAEFWPFYLDQHKDVRNRALHVAGTLLGLCTLAYALTTNWLLIPLAPVVIYTFAWTGHFAFEKNRPATFDHVLLSAVGDFKMVFRILKSRDLSAR